MIYSSIFRESISLNHYVPGLPGHGNGSHPHYWIVDFRFTGDPIAADGMAVITAGSRQRIIGIVGEYKDRDLNELIGAGIPSLEGFAMALWERIKAIEPNLARIDVFDGIDERNHGFSITT